MVGYLELPGAGHGFDMIDGARTGSAATRHRVVPQPDSSNHVRSGPKRLSEPAALVRSPMGRGSGETAQRLGCGAAVQRNAERAHAHHQGRRDRRHGLRRRASTSTRSAQSLRRRLHKLEPLRYQLVDIPLKFHHPMWRENVRGRLELPPPPGAAAPPRAAAASSTRLIGEIASTPLDRSPPAVGDVLRRGPGQRPVRGDRQDPPRAGRRRRLGEPDGHGPWI